MKRDDLLKVGLTVICSAVLSACGSSGSNNDGPTTGSNPTVNNLNNVQNQNQNNNTGNTGNTGNAAAPGQVDSKPLTQQPDEDPAFGYKHVVKTDSNVNLNVDSGRNGASIPSIMDAHPLFPSLDTIVVVSTEKYDKANRQSGYLEDFDFRGSNAENAQSGKFELQHIYLENAQPKDAEGNPLPRLGTGTAQASVARPGGKSTTKTATQGTQSGVSYVYQDNRLNYTDFFKNFVDTKGVEVDQTKPENSNRYALDDTNKPVEKTVAEIYGYRTFAKGGDDANYHVTDPYNLEAFRDEERPNLPLVDTKDTTLQKAQLKNVQYGRVTSAMSGTDRSNFKRGLEIGRHDTFIVPFGHQGDEGTEDNYFYRGVNRSSEKELAALQGKLSYYGHAVSYGLDNGFLNTDSAKLPNALGGSRGLVSGNHVQAEVDMATKEVNGRIFNKWYVSSSTNADKLVDSDLVSFQGKMAANGNIAGTATRLDGQKDKNGLFGATLFGDQAQEMGGNVSSTAKDPAQRWGAVFGAVRKIEPTPPAPPPPKPTPHEPGGLYSDTNNNSGGTNAVNANTGR